MPVPAGVRTVQGVLIARHPRPAPPDMAPRNPADLQGRAALGRWFARHLAAGECRSLALAGGTLFTVERRPGVPLDTVVARPADGEVRTVLDPRTVGGPGATVLGVAPAPGGTRLAVAIRTGSGERALLHVIEADNGAVLPDAIPHTGHASVAWWPDGDGFFYVRRPHRGSVRAGEVCDGLSVWAHRIGDDAADDRSVLVPGSPLAVSQLDVSADGHHLLVALHHPAGATEVRLLDIFTREWRRLPLPGRAPVHARLAAGALWAVVRDSGPGGRLVRWSLNDDGAAVTAVPAGPAVLHEIVPAGDGVAVHASRGPASVVLRCSLRTASEAVPLGLSRGPIVALAGEAGGGVAALVAHDRLGAAPELVEVRQGTVLRRKWYGRPPGPAPHRRRFMVDGPAGERLVTVLHHPDRGLDRQTPAVLGLDSGGIAGRALSPWHRLGLRLLLEAGGAYAMVSAPAGAAVTAADLARAAGHLADAGVVAADVVALEGAPGPGALAVGRALARYPERFCAAVLRNAPAQHGAARPRAIELEELTATWAFLFAVLGLPVEGATAEP